MKSPRKERIGHSGSLPGWRMTRAQHAHYFDLWAEACKWQGWDRLSTKDKDAKRKEIMADVFGGPKSAKDVDKDEEFGKIKARFLLLAGKVKGGVEDGRPHYDQRRRLLNVIEQKKKLLAIYTDQSEEYLHVVLKDRFKRVNGINSIDDLSAQRVNNKPSQLEMLVFTLSARINDMRNQAGHTIHEMNQLAGLTCPSTCKMCRLQHRASVSGETFADATDEVAVEPDIEGRDDRAGRDSAPRKTICSDLTSSSSSEEVLVESDDNVPF
jgi:hypothetical protein